MEQPNKAKVITPKELATKLGITPQRLRSFLRAHFAREVKGRSWQLSPQLANQVVKLYRTKTKQKEQKNEKPKEAKRS